ncbi:MAG: hypothetical protein MJZ77_02130 [Bacteroidales bacterium]|nr:hypothetical protein [Bacteroidales bacterium]
MKKLLNRNSILAGVVLCLLAELLCAALLWLVLLLLGIPAADHLRWFAVAFLPPLLLLRYYAKCQSYPDTLKAVITTFFVTFVLFMWYMLKYRYITFN